MDPEFSVSNHPEPITHLVPVEYRRRGVGRVQRPKECFHYAWLYVIDNAEVPGVLLIHGTYLDGEGHCRVELPGNIAFDATTQEFYRADEYRLAMNARIIRTYTPYEVAKLTTATGHTGPWGDLTAFPDSPESPGSN